MAAGGLPSFRLMTHVGVLPLARDVSRRISADSQGSPACRLYFGWAFLGPFFPIGDPGLFHAAVAMLMLLLLDQRIQSIKCASRYGKVRRPVWRAPKRCQVPAGLLSSRCSPPATAANHAAAAPRIAAAPAMKAKMTVLWRARAMFSFALAIAASVRRSASGAAKPVLAETNRTR
jgi:hypothetical protein